MTIVPLSLPEPSEPERAQHYEQSELGNARRLVTTFGDDLHYVSQMARWFVWDGRRWAEDITGHAVRRAKAVTDDMLNEARILADDKKLRWGLRSQSNGSINSMLSLASTEAGIPLLIDELDPDPFAFGAGNGTIDLRSGVIRPHSRRDLVTRITEVAYHPDAGCPTWDRFLLDVFDGDQDLIDFVQRFAGYSLTGDVSEQVMVFAHGSGRNGKTTLLNTLRGITGDYGMQLDPAVLTGEAGEQHPTGLTDLRGARFVATVETEQGNRLNESLVKQLTGGDPIRARRMRQDFFEFLPTHKLWFAGNHLPRIGGTDIGIWRRLALLPFRVEFGPEKADRHLPAKLAAESAGILAWAVQGCLWWQSDGLGIPTAVTEATGAYRESQDHIGRFMADVCVVGPSCYVATAQLRDAYEKWCHDQGERAWSAQAMGRELTAKGFQTTTLGTGFDRRRGWIGVGLMADERGTESVPSGAFGTDMDGNSVPGDPFMPPTRRVQAFQNHQNRSKDTP